MDKSTSSNNKIESTENQEKSAKTKVKKNLVSINNVSQTASKKEGKKKKTNSTLSIKKSVSNETLDKSKKKKVTKKLKSINNVSPTSSKKEGKRKLKVTKEHKVIKKMKKTSV